VSLLGPRSKPFVLVLCLSLMAIACGPASSPAVTASSSPTQTSTASASATAEPAADVTFWQFSDRQVEIDAYSALVTKFQAAHPTIKIHMQIVPWSDAVQKVTTAITSGGLPDVSMMGNDAVAQYAHIGALAPLDSYFAAESAKLGHDITQDFWPGDSLYYHTEGHWWGSPVAEDVLALYYRTDLFQKAGISAPPTTWDEMLADAKLLNSSSVAGWGALQSIDYVTLQTFMSVYLSYGARFLNDQGTCGFDTPEFRQALDYYTGIFKAGLTPADAASMTYVDMESAWKSGKLGMFIDSAYLVADTQAQNPDVASKTALAPVPGGAKGMFAFLGGWPLVLWNTSKVKDAAAEWIVFATSSDNVGELDRAAGELPGRPSLTSQAPWNADPWKVFIDELPHAVPYLYPAEMIPQMGSLETSTVQTAVQSVALGQASLDEATKTLCETINTALSQ
jgi:multiple sugar transport system substrate-binding protein